ncbi:MAG: toast rack family protein [Bryobacteraceae bacterium]|nr:toast rack family protein [Bryobacteraceae bacterium]
MTKFALVGALLLVAGGCRIATDPGPVRTASQPVEGGNAEMVNAEITMTAGELEILGGAPRLLDASFRYSEKLGKPEVHYEATGFRGRLRVEAPGASLTGGDITNEWKLVFGDKYPLDMRLRMGAGEGTLDFSKLPLRKLQAELGAGELKIDLRGAYPRGVEADIRGGVGEATIRLPSAMGVVADAKGGIGSIETRGLIRRGDRYYNEAYTETKPAIRLSVRGGVGQINLIVE